jgi:thiol-disulfide isomerase/thioredoxin
MAFAGDFVLVGRIEGMAKGRLYLNYLPGGDRMGIIDSCEVMNGSFEFKGSIAEPCLTTISTFNLFTPGYVYNAKNISEFYLEGGHITIQLTFNQFENLKVAGSATENDRVALELLKAPIRKRMRPVAEKYRMALDAWRSSKDSATMVSQRKEIDTLSAELDDFQKQMWKIDSLFIIEHPQSYLAADMLSQFRYEDIAFPSLNALYSRFPQWIKECRPGQMISKEIEKEKFVHVGGDAYSFTALTSRGDTLQLDRYRGKKYVLLDFWASWCHPCRQITPLLKKLYRLHAKDLEIISISLNDKVDDWRTAIATDKMEWPQINGDSKLFVIAPPGGSIPDVYHVNLLPSLILLDKNLKIVQIFGGWYRAKPAYQIEKVLENLLDH